MYKQLLISAGGGIISRNQQAEQSEKNVTIAIGLGGTGISCLRALKKEVYDRIKPDVDDPLIPKYKHIKFLAIDTDWYSLRDESANPLDRDMEFLDLSCPDLAMLPWSANILKHSPCLKWLTVGGSHGEEAIRIIKANAGAGGVRQIGRLLFFQRCNSFVEKLTSLINEARQELPDAEINIHIFTGLSGGTGSGIFLDVCYIIQHVLVSMGIYGNTTTSGYFFLPDVNIGKVRSAYVQEYIKSNGFAAMKELDYCMNFDANGDEWNQEYDKFTIKTKNQPVDVAYLISATNAAEVMSADAYEHSMHIVVEHVMSSIISVDPVDPFAPVIPERNLGYKYCALGVATAYIPYKEITTYLTSKIFEGFSKIEHQLPGDNDIDLFVQTTGLKYEDLCKDLRAKVPAVPLYEVDTRIIYEQTEGLSPDVIPQVLGQMRDSLARIGGQVTENKRSMLQALEIIDEDSQSGIASLISRVRKKIMEISQQPDKGPYYGGAILHSVKAKDLQNIVDGYIEQNSRNLSNARADKTLRDESVAKALRELQNSNILNRNGRGKTYVQAVYACYKRQADIEVYATLGDLLVSFKKQINDLYTKEFAVFETVMRELEATFSANLTFLGKSIGKENDYAIKLRTIKDLKDSLDASVKEMSIDDLISKFVNYMLVNTDVWIAYDETKISHAVSQFFLQQLEQYTNRTIVDYLTNMLGTIHPGIIEKVVYDDIMQPLLQKVTPQFWCDRNKHQVSAVERKCVCMVPRFSQEIIVAANRFSCANPNVMVRSSCTDRISILAYYGIPIYLYKGFAKDWVSRQWVGMHIYEGTDEDSRDWRNLPDFSAVSEYTHP